MLQISFHTSVLKMETD